jgi:uncharacterized protein (TIGR03086 family)
VRAVLNHLVGGNRIFAGILRGEQPPSPEDLARLRTMDQLGDDPAAVYRDSASDLVSAFSQPAALERVVQVPAGTVPGMVALHLRITEALVHGWDLAQATGQPARLPDDLAQEELEFARGRSAPDVPRTGHPFGPVQPVGDNAPAIDRLAAYLGRPAGSGSTMSDRG